MRQACGGELHVAGTATSRDCHHLAFAHARSCIFHERRWSGVISKQRPQAVAKKKKAHKKKGPYTGIAGHARVKSQLVAPINSLPHVELIDWYRDLLPEHLWIDLLVHQFGESRYLPMFNRLLDRLQAAAGEEPVVHGYISEFGLFPESRRAAF